MVETVLIGVMFLCFFIGVVTGLIVGWGWQVGR